MQEAVDFVRQLFKEQLQLGARAEQLTEESLILGAIPEFDSMSVVALITAIEEQLGVAVEDDEISAEIFESVGSLAAFVAEKMG